MRLKRSDVTIPARAEADGNTRNAAARSRNGIIKDANIKNPAIPDRPTPRSQLIQRIRRTIDGRGLLPEGVPVVAGISGGADSMALLHILHELNIPFTAAHLNHRLRGGESDADEAFVRETTETMGIPLTVHSVDVKELASDEGLSIEMAARQARHAFFSGFGDSAIALAHHSDDQVETFFLKLARGAGSEGLCGMSFRQQLGPLRLIRPLLDVSRHELRAWLKDNGHAWREDSSNTETDYLRNRVRHSILPLMENELNPGMRKVVLRTMDILREENAWMEAQLPPGLPGRGTEPALRRRMLRRWLFDQGIYDTDFETVESILRLMDKGSGSSIVPLGLNRQVVIEYGLPRIEDHPIPAAPPEWILIREDGTGWHRDHGRGIGILPAEASFDADRIGSEPVTIRTWQAGDRFEPLGMEGSRKIQDILTDAKVPRAERGHIPLVVCKDEIIWIPGYRIARGWAVSEADGRSVHIRIEQRQAG